MVTWTQFYPPFSKWSKFAILRSKRHKSQSFNLIAACQYAELEIRVAHNAV
jgi:hypothetical protein